MCGTDIDNDCKYCYVCGEYIELDCMGLDEEYGLDDSQLFEIENYETD